MPVRTARRDNYLFRLRKHDDRGLIHIEAQDERDFTLGIFQIWKQPPSSTQLLDGTAGAVHQIAAAEDAQLFTGSRAPIAQEYAPLRHAAAVSLWAIG